jgi:hypothetical protein
MIWRYVSGIFRIFISVAVAASIIFSLRAAYSPYRLLEMYGSSRPTLLVLVILTQLIACYLAYMIVNAVREFKNRRIGLKVFYILTTIIIVGLNIAMIMDFINSHDKLNRLRSDAWADTLAVSSLFFAIIDIFPLFILKKPNPVNENSHRFNPDDYQDIVPERSTIQP